MDTFDLFSLKGKNVLITGGRAMYGKGATLEKLADEIGKDKAYTDLEKLKINGLDAIAYSEVDSELKVTFQHVSFVTDDGYIMTFSYWDMADEDYQNLVVCMVASIQPEETEESSAAA